jgi:hypothetical protein
VLFASERHDTTLDIHKCLVSRHNMINSLHSTRCNDNTRRLTDSDNVLKCSSPARYFHFLSL